MGLDADWIGSHPEHHEPKGALKFATHHPNFGHITYRVHLVKYGGTLEVGGAYTEIASQPGS